MSDFKYDGQGRIWEDWPMPKHEDYQLKISSKEYQDDVAGLKPSWQSIFDSNYQNKLKSYNSRPSYPVHPELQKLWKKDQRVKEGVDYILSDYSEWAALQAIPLPVRSEEAEIAAAISMKSLNHVFQNLPALDEKELRNVLWNAGVNAGQMDAVTNSLIDYFKEKFNIDL